MQFSRKYFLIFLILLSVNSLFALEYNWGKEYKISIRQVSDFVSELKIVDRKTKKVFFESLTTMKSVIKTKQKKIAGRDFFFIQSVTGGEGMVTSNLHYFFMDGKILKQGAVEDIIEFNLRDLDGDKNKEIILTDFAFYKFKIKNCFNSLEPDPHYTGKLLPIIYQIHKDKFILIKEDKELLKRYLKKLERKLLKKKKFKNLYGYSHYYAVAKKVGQENRALSYFKSNNSDFTYACENTQEQFPKGQSFQWKTDYYSFFSKYGKDIF